ncbi:MAG: DUF2569 domain-containing protein [Nitrospira sp.]|nr:DUF2569 domain-containing protein [bacterium]MBL7048525.1 DUF2569 domain-containing protein [Nitrospira sp.]
MIIQNNNTTGIKGWLLLPAVSMITTPLILAGFLGINIKLITDTQIIATLAEYPGAHAAMIAQTMIVAVQLVLGIYTAIHFFKKKQDLPLMIIAFLTIHLLVIIANLSLTYMSFNEINLAEYSGLTAAIFMTAAGIPYFLKSKRVHATFINI